MRMKKSIASLFLLTLTLLFSAPPAEAFQFTKGYIIGDDEADDSHYLSTSGIQAFLEEKGSVLANYTTKDVDGSTRSAAEIINAASKKYNINPLFFLVMGQKESSAITSRGLTGSITNCWLGYASCASDHSFTEQTYAMGNAFRNRYLRDLYTRGYTVSGWAIGVTKTTVDGQSVTPQNNITAALYTYNPLVGRYGGGDQRYGANSAFQKLWEEWYIPTAQYFYRSGSLLRIGDSIYLIQGNKKHRFSSMSSLLANYDPNKIIPVPAIVGERYEEGYSIRFPAFSLLQSPDGAIYLYANGRKRGFTSRDAFRQYGFNPVEIIPVTQAEINEIPTGIPIQMNQVDPRGSLVQNTANGAVSYITPRGRRRDVVSREILNIRFQGYEIIPMAPEKIDTFKKGQPVLLKDGMIVTSPKANAVFFIANNKKHPFPSQKVFRQYGYQPKHIVQVSDNVLQLHSTGKPMRLKEKKGQKD